MDESRSTTPSEPVRVLRLLRELHRRGYQRLRLHCGWSPNGMAWRYGIAPVGAFASDGLHMRTERYPGRAFASTRGNGPPFSLEGAEASTTQDLADAFSRRFEGVVEAGRGPDPTYDAWFARLLSRCEPDGIPIMYADDYDARDDGILIAGTGERFPLPPPIPGA